MAKHCYYTLEQACNTKETGPIYPQIQKMKSGYDEKKNDSVYSYLKGSIYDFAPENPDLNSFILHRRAKATDLISNAITDAHGFFISAKLKSILEECHLPPHKFHQAQLIQNGKFIEGYFWLHIISDYSEIVNYPQSTFFIYQRNTDSNSHINITSKADFAHKEELVKRENPGTYTEIRAEKIHIGELCDTKLDLLQIGKFDFSFYISRQLAESLIKNNITGCEIKSTEKLLSGY